MANKEKWVPFSHREFEIKKFNANRELVENWKYVTGKDIQERELLPMAVRNMLLMEPDRKKLRAIFPDVSWSVTKKPIIVGRQKRHS